MENGEQDNQEDADVLEYWRERSGMLMDAGHDTNDSDFYALVLTAAWCRRTGRSIPRNDYFYARRQAEEWVWNDDTGVADSPQSMATKADRGRPKLT